MKPPLVLFESYSRERDPASYAFSDCDGELAARRLEEVAPALAEVERAAAAGRHAAGYLAYEAAPALDAALKTHPSGPLPLLWFGLFKTRTPVRPGGGCSSPGGGYRLSPWRSSISRRRYNSKIRRIRDYIAAGDAYQVNFTFRMESEFQGDDRAFYRDLCLAQRASYCAYLNLGRHRLLSASPELFFSLKKDAITARPMKGTRPRGRWLAEDELQARALRDSEKDRAENVMIVDLVRNDLGRIAQTGSVEVPCLWEVERYETVLQMTSTVSARIRPGMSLFELLAALFPCGSVTGAPKVRAMEIITELESSPRGAYTGAIGFVSPGPEAVFNVAIRTVWVDSATGVAQYGVGGGITYDSNAAGEYEECRVKAKVLTAQRPEGDLLETILFEPPRGYFLLERHLERLQSSARYFGFSCDLDAVTRELQTTAAQLDDGPHRIRLRVSRGGEIRIDVDPLAQGPPEPWRAALSDDPVSSRNPLLFHKTTCRAVYETRLAAHPDCDEVILRNERGEATECCVGNLVAVLDGRRWTPPVECGLLPGAYRAELLEQGEIVERVLTAADLKRAEALYLINSVRRWVRLALVKSL